MSHKDESKKIIKEMTQKVDDVVNEIIDDDFLGHFVTKEQAPALREALVKAQNQYFLITQGEMDWPSTSARKQRKELNDFAKLLSKTNELWGDMGSDTWRLIYDSVSEAGKSDDFIDNWSECMQELESISWHLFRNYKGKPGRPVNQAFFLFINILAEFWNLNTDTEDSFSTGWSSKYDNEPREPLSPADEFIVKSIKIIDLKDQTELPHTMRKVISFRKTLPKLS
jgi:hypothetical protein